MLRDAHGVQDVGRTGRGVHLRRLADVVGRHAADLRRLLYRHGVESDAQGLVVLRALGDELLVLPAHVDDVPHHAVQQGHVAARLQPQVQMRPPGHVDETGVGHDEGLALTQRLDHLEREHRVRLGGVRADDEDDIGLVEVVDGVGHRSTAKSRRQTGDRGAVS